MASYTTVNAVSACVVSKTFFTPACGEAFNYSPETSDPENLGRYLFQKAQQHYVVSFGVQALEEFPQSARHLRQVLQPILHPLYLDRLEKECESFNLLVGARISSAEDPGLTSDAIVASMTNGDWLEEICLAISNACFKEVAPNVGQAPVSPHQPRLIPQFDGPSDSIVEMIGHIAQVTIIGPSLKKAWARCPYTRNLDSMAPQEPPWSPNQPGGMYLYHGTSEHLGSSRAMVDLTAHPFAGLEGRCTRNQVTQDGRGLPVAWTAFGPFRAFLWAVFGADVIQSSASLALHQHRDSAWQAQGHSYAGVLVFKFASSQPSPPGCTAYTIPTEAPWSSFRHTLGPAARTDSPATLWSRFRDFHQQPLGTNWPELVHGLQPYTKRYWQTAWTGVGIQALNSRHEETMAIRYIMRPDGDG